MSVKATLNGVPLIGDPLVRWEMIEGVRPYEASFAVRASEKGTLLGGGLKPLVLKIDDGQGRALTVSFLYAIAEAPTEFPAIAMIRVVDRRWFWSFAHVSRVFNRRRVVGSKRRRSPDTPPELEPLVPEIAFHPATLKDGKKLWTAEEALSNVLRNCLEPENGTVHRQAPFSISPKIGKELDNLPLEDVELEDSAENALARLMSYLPEARVKVTAQGLVRIYSALEGLDKTLVDATKPELYGFGHVSLISNANIRPSAIHVLFTKEHEVRFDFEETGSRTVLGDQRSISNVMPLPDFSLNVAGKGVLDQGTWISLVDAFNNWPAPPRFGHLKDAGTWFGALREMMVPYMDLWTGLGLAGARVPDADWMGRIGAIQEHYRRTWRINPDWMARIEQLKAYLVGTIDPSTGTRAPALVYTDFARLASQRSLWTETLGEDKTNYYAMNVQGSYAPDQKIKEKTAAPFTLTVLDEDQGILHYDFVSDRFRIYESAIPGMVSLGNSSSGGQPVDAGPTANIENVQLAIAFNAISERHSPPILTTPFRVSVLLTAVPATYNTSKNRHLYRITKKPGDVKQFLPTTLHKGIDAAAGPELEIRVGATIETARVAWDTDAAGEIEKSFGITGGEPSIDNLIVNLEGDAEGGASLDAIATALATKTYAMLADRFLGERSVPLHPGADPVGHIESVGHEVTTEGAVLTNIRLPEKLNAIDLFSLLPDSTRRLILRQAPSPGKRP